MNDFVKSGQFICDLRKKMGLTQSELAERLGVSDKTVSKWERGTNIPDVLMLKEIAKLFDITVDELINARKKDDLDSTCFKYFQDKRIRYSIIGIVSALFIALIVFFIYFCNNFGQSCLYTMKDSSDDYDINGVLIVSNRKLNVVINYIELFNDLDMKDLKATDYTLTFYLNNIPVYKTGDVQIGPFYSKGYADVYDLFKEVQKLYFTVPKFEMTDKIFNGYMSITVLNNEVVIKNVCLDFDTFISLENNKFFY